MRRILALGTAVTGVAGLALATLGALAGAGSQSPAYRLNAPGLAADSSSGAAASAPANGLVQAVRTSCYRDASGGVHAVGEVANGLNRPAANVLISVTLLDGETVAGQGSGYALLPTISGGRFAPFEVLLAASSPAFTGCTAEVTQYTSEGTIPAIPYGLEVSLGTPTVDGAGAIHIPGTIRNRSGQGWRLPRAYAVLTGEDGKVLMVASADAKPGEISPGLEATFEAVFPVGQELGSFGMAAFVWAEAPPPTPTPTPTR